MDQGGIEPTTFELQSRVITDCATWKGGGGLKDRYLGSQKIDRDERQKTPFFGVTKRRVTQKLGGLAA